ncbi:hypothetical protein AXF42_Ash019670 [Apostasia shenzhenica]|uniref:Uncharacterized protein n=1 Tax=Apostasia shenzhenica TaxID=1088818 RepID=A0A2H9ZTS2_9ASPA|nr:hypothetical protein AXF42_Ash019670 [Apostasia shenzhenica]
MPVVGDHHYFFFNSFTLAEIPIQPYPRQPPEVADQVGEFSSAPTYVTATSSCSALIETYNQSRLQAAKDVVQSRELLPMEETGEGGLLPLSLISFCLLPTDKWANGLPARKCLEGSWGVTNPLPEKEKGRAGGPSTSSLVATTPLIGDFCH